MSRKNFLSIDFFVPTSESEARRILLSLPGHFSQLTLLKEDTIIHSTRFLYDHSEKGLQYYVDVSILPLNDQYVRFCLHGMHTNGQIIQDDAEIKNVLLLFERSIHAGFTNDFSFLEEETKTSNNRTKSFSLVQSFLSIFLSKYHY
jgi:hypothetical protein